MIKVLDKKTADKIAAGEVVDRPVSIVKELIENSIDSGADSITIEIREGGKTYIRVTDNGCGIPEDDVETAFLRHATSKINNERDLNAIRTLGFRGEALASICAVSRVELISKCSDNRLGRKVLVEGSVILENAATGCPNGTTITIRDLFYNVPARRKFLSSDASESRKIIDFASRIALSYSDIRFTMLNGNKTVFTTSGRGNILNNILNIYGTDIGKELIPVEASKALGDAEDNDSFVLKGFVSDPGNTLSSRSRQIFCINGRIVASDIIEKALDKAYKERLFTGRFPIAFLFLSVPANKLDVNIHPTKREVRFDDSSEIEDFVRDSIAAALATKEAIPSVKLSHRDQGNQIDFKTYVKEEPHAYEAKANEEIIKIEKPEKKETANDNVDINSLLATLREQSEKIEQKLSLEVDAPHIRPFDFDELNIIGAVFNTYIAVEDASIFYLIDQHAAHERIFYEQLLKQYNSEDKMIQTMLVPLNFNVSADLCATEEQWIKCLRMIGYDIELFGRNLYIVRGIPAFMEQVEAERFLKDFFNEFAERADFTDESVLNKIIMHSCKSAIKAGDKLDDSEITALLTRLAKCKNPFSCPHGRPTFIKMTKHEIERMFKRA